MVLAVLGALGCLQPATRSCALGGICPEGLRCATVGGVDTCVLPTCGDGRTDPGEDCDDGNNAAGDGCPANCVIACGDGEVDGDEVCDDGNTAGGDGCSADCRSTEVCGNGIVDALETCDDGARDSHDGCSARCTSEAPVWRAIDTAPPARASHAMAYDAAHGTTVLFGGRGALGPLGDTWVWDGAIWRRLDPATLPPPRSEHAMAYDADRKRVVLFGGSSAEHSTWEWDGVRWTELQPAVAPSSALLGSAMAYDADRRRIVLFGGTLDGADQSATWEWNGDAWREVATATVPPPRSGHAMAYDARRGRIVVFGGLGAGQRLSDTWEFDGADWIAPSVAIAPAARAHATMAFDTERIVLSGGDGDAGLVADTWTWDGAQWSPTAAGPAPRARSAAAMTYDVARDQLVLFGGEQLLDPAVTAAGLSSETWSWQHAAWTPRSVSPAMPESRESFGLVYEPVRGRVVVFGGLTTALRPNMPPGVFRDLALNDTWEWDGATWIRDTSPTAPSPRQGFAMASDGRRIVLFGGLETVQDNSSPMNDTWVLVDTQWVRRSPRSAPSRRFNAAMAYDPSRDKLVLFGGHVSPVDVSETWEWDGAEWTQRFPLHVPRARSFPAMAFDPAAGRVLMFGGATVVDHVRVDLDDTWAWDGDDWILQTTTRTPAAGAGHAIAHDAARGTIVVFDGDPFPTPDHVGATWEWDGADWRSRTPAIAPRQHEGVAMAYDAARDRTVMFGGTWSASGGSVVSEWDGSDWRDVAPVSGLPGARSQSAMVYDAERGAVVLFGGGTGADLNHAPSRALNDTWTWNGLAWREQHPAMSPSATFGSRIAFDRLRRRAVMFAASGASETWEWDGATWLLRAAGAGPTTRSRPAMVYDAARHQTFLIGGSQGEFDLPVAEHWAWDGEIWSQLTPNPPFALVDAAAAYDARRDRVVLFGGIGVSGKVNELWEWNGSRWIKHPSTGAWPPARSGHTLVYDPVRQRSVLFGGITETNFVLNDLWEWDGTSWTQIHPTSPLPPPRRDHAMVYDEARRALVLFGGNDSWKELQDVWLLRYDDPAVPDEVAP